ncbi:MAG: nickel pincer cofactor biosynthesis protein LarC [Firmicutes bacterium]|nr:nickel pincer cofactor biosynthesis protein LarC [Bacillota bacterium]
MRIAYFDCFSGISGDMTLGALLDAGIPLEQIEAGLRRLPLAGWTITAEKVRRGALAATQVHVTAQDQKTHRHLSQILDLIAAADLPSRVVERARRIFERLGAAEARIHNVPIENVHFHEVGAVDAILDIVGACLGFELAGIETFVCSPVNVGGGRARTAHGTLPVPAPAAAELLKGAATYSTGVDRELATPTGVAIASTLATQFGPLPPMRVEAIGYGAGSWELAEQPNVLRLFLGETAPEPTVRATRAGPEETIAVLETNLDDMNPQLYGYFVERALAAGALDVFATPVLMKKNRPGQLVTVLCPRAAVAPMMELLFRETTTIGVRWYEMQRRCLERELVAVETPHGTVRVKVARLDGRVLNVAPEFDDCRCIAEQTGLPLKQVMAEATLCFEKSQQ